MLKTISSSLTISRKTGRNVGKPSRGRVNLPDGEVNSGKRNRGTGEIPCVSIVPGVNQIVAFNPKTFGNKVLIASSFGESVPNSTQTDVKSGGLGINFDFLENGGNVNLDGSFEVAKNCNWSTLSENQIFNEVKKGNAPRQVERFDKGAGELDYFGARKDPAQVHFKDCNNCALLRDGTWKHTPPDNFYIQKATQKWLEQIGWKIPPQ